MKKADLVQRVRDQFILGDQGQALTYEAAEWAVDCVLRTIKHALAEHEYVVIRKVGRFKIQHKNERVGLNPKTGVHHAVSARTVVKFAPGIVLRREVNNGGTHE